MNASDPATADAACPICGASGFAPVLSKDGFTIVRCASCDTLQVSPLPSAQFLQAYYQGRDYFHGQKPQGYRNYEDLRKALVPLFRRRMRAIDALSRSRGRLLDFGCAAGFFLQVAKTAGWQVAGVEVSEEIARSASQTLGIPIAHSLEASRVQDMDVITLWEVLEHLRQPVIELRQLYDRLRPGGLLALSTPNSGHWQAQRDPDVWESYRPPAHLYFFTERTLTALLQRVGFERVVVRRVAPLPPLPGWLGAMTGPLQAGISDGQARAWPLAIWAWRIVRIIGWGWQRLFRPRDDIFATLEALGFRPS